MIDDRTLLVGAFAAFAQQLEQIDRDPSDAVLPTLSGNHDADWAYPASLPAGYVDGDTYGFGFLTSPMAGLAETVPQEALAPLFLTTVDPGSPAAKLGLRPGDVIEAVNGNAPFADGVLSPGVVEPLFNPDVKGTAVRLTLHRPWTGRTWTVTAKPDVYTAPPPTVSSKLLAGDVAYIELPVFDPDAADDVLKAIANLAQGRTLHGVVLDLRGNGGRDRRRARPLPSTNRAGPVRRT